MDTNSKWHARRHGGFSGAIVALLLSSACASPIESSVIETADDPGLGPALATGGDPLPAVVGFGISQNGISQNGLEGNGLSQNGLAARGLTTAGISTSGFATWFNAHPVLSNLVLRYLYRCAGSSTKSLAWTNPATGIGYTWTGGLGLAPGWTGGAAATVAEQQVVTACLGALVNKFGVSVSVAVEGRTAAGTQLAIGSNELTTYSVREACFFGNLFSSQGIFVGADHDTWGATISSARACGIDADHAGESSDCPPLYNVGDCSKVCEHDKTKTFYETCTWNGVAYKPLATRLRPLDVYSCGDGVCQVSESCGTGSIAASCRTDCGTCP